MAQTHPQTPDRSIDIPIRQLARQFEDCREIDISILSALKDHPCTVSFLSGQIDHQPSYISQRLAVLQEQEIVIDLDRGFYEVSAAVIDVNGDRDQDHDHHPDHDHEEGDDNHA